MNLTGINWAVIGGESGSGARPMDVAWVHSLIKLCRAQGVAPWVKQLGKSPSDKGELFHIRPEWEAIRPRRGLGPLAGASRALEGPRFTSS